MAMKEAAIPPELARKFRRLTPSFLETRSASSLMRYSTSFCFSVCGLGRYSPFETICVGMGDLRSSTSSARSRPSSWSSLNQESSSREPGIFFGMVSPLAFETVRSVRLLRLPPARSWLPGSSLRTPSPRYAAVESEVNAQRAKQVLVPRALRPAPEYNRTMELRERAERLLALHRGILVLPNAWDVASARVVEEAGFPALATSSAGIAAVLGYPDGQRVPRDEMLEMVSRIVRAVRVPVTADLEAGYGSVGATVEAALRAGAVGMNLEDSRGEGALATVEEHAASVREARAAADPLGVPLCTNSATRA